MLKSHMGLRYKLATRYHNFRNSLRVTFLPNSKLSPGEKFRKSGGMRLLMKVDLPPQSHVLDFGGYHGDFSASIQPRDIARIDIFEPVPTFAEIIQNRFMDDYRIQVHAYAIGKTSRRERFTLDASATGKSNTGDVDVEFREAGVLKEIQSDFFDLVKMNIEGGEYELIESLDEINYLRKIRTILIQFHNFNGEDFSQARLTLSKTHTPVWQFEYVWERWDLNASELMY